MRPSSDEFACHSKECAPPPAGTGGSKGGSTTSKIRAIQAEIAGNSRSRSQMPQIPGDKSTEFDAYVKANGATIKLRRVNPNSLKATQNEIGTSNVLRAMNGLKSGQLRKPITASNDGYVIDGHHTWAAARVLSRPVAVRQVSLGQKTLLKLTDKFAKKERTKSKSVDEFACYSKACAPPPTGTGGSKGGAGGGGIDGLFKGAQRIVNPFPRAGRMKGESKVPSRGALAAALKNPKLVDVDPNEVKSQQAWVTREGVKYYMTDQYRTTGRTYADHNQAGNRFPVVWKKSNGDKVILSGNHRFTAALIEGRPQKAIMVEE